MPRGAVAPFKFLRSTVMLGTLSPGEEAQLMQTIEMFEVITQSQPQDYQSLEILKEAYFKLGRQKDVINTSKRIAQAYVQLGQLSSAILEYETILQRYPDDPDVLAAMAEIESKANSLAINPVASANDGGAKPQMKSMTGRIAAEVDDGRQAMHKLFVEGKMVAQSDFDACWPSPNLFESPSQVVDPFIQVLSERNILHIEKSLKLLSDRARLGFLPLERYELDVELARSFPRDACMRWCVLPFDRMSKSVLVATTNPFNKQAAEDLQAATPNRLLWYLAPPEDMQKLLRKIFR
jgi:tetratricopeptide (TPR) repeat protein